jgi:transposase
LADHLGRPVAFALRPGNIADITLAIPLLGAVDKPKRLLADKAYDADSFHDWLRRKIKPVIPQPRLDGPHTRSPQCHRAHVLQVEKLATHRYPI